MVLASDSPRAATSVGLSPMAWRIFIVSVGCALGALAGSLNAFQVSVVSPDSYTFHFAMLILVAAVVGGSITGAWWGAAIVTFVPVIFKAEQELSTALFGIVIIATLFILPKDLSGMDVLRRPRRLAKARPDAPPVEQQPPATAITASAL
jgi:branched-chain amino acid transport system permease protein